MGVRSTSMIYELLAVDLARHSTIWDDLGRAGGTTWTTWDNLKQPCATWDDLGQPGATWAKLGRTKTTSEILT